MITLKLKLFITFFFYYAIFITPAFSQTIIKVFDQNNLPLPNAVIEFVVSQPSLNKTVEDRPYVMDQINKQFSPHVLVVPLNSLVSFPNSDDIRHHVYSFSPAKTFQLKLYAGKPKSPVRFDEKGVVVMGCNIHDYMVGYIYVSAKDNAYITNEKGEVKLDHTLALDTELQIWHPNSIMGVSKHTLLTIDQDMINKNVIDIILNVNTPALTDSFEEFTADEY
jgi:plastocyanin